MPCLRTNLREETPRRTLLARMHEQTLERSGTTETRRAREATSGGPSPLRIEVAQEGEAAAQQTQRLALRLALAATASIEAVQSGESIRKIWRRRPDLNRGWRFCRFNGVVNRVVSCWSLVCPAPPFYLVLGPYWTTFGLRCRCLRNPAIVSLSHLGSTLSLALNQALRFLGVRERIAHRLFSTGFKS